MSSMLSIIEFVIYSCSAYVPFFILCVHILKGGMVTSALNTHRIFIMVPGMIACVMLALVAPIKITLYEIRETNYNMNDTLTSYTDITSSIDLQQEVWIIFHMMLFFIYVFFMFSQVFVLWISAPKKDRF